MGKVYAERYHDFSTGHRVHGHESKCSNLHGHNYRVHFKVRADELDIVGRVVDFSVIKALLAEWLEEHWDHKFLAWEQDPVMKGIVEHSRFFAGCCDANSVLDSSIVWVPFNPTAENMAKFLVEVVGPAQLPHGLVLTEVQIEETRKCSASYEA